MLGVFALLDSGMRDLDWYVQLLGEGAYGDVVVGREGRSPLRLRMVVFELRFAATVELVL